jgi:hypothetical protein
MGRYKGLKPELEKVVDSISIGDGIIIEHPEDYIADRTIGYVKGFGKSYLTLTKTRTSNHIFEDVWQFLGQMSVYRFDTFENVRVVDSIE